MSDRRKQIRKIILFTTFAAIFSGLMLPERIVKDQITLFSVALILAGIPHGASDYLVFRKLSAYFSRRGNSIKFFGSYLLATALYAVVWYFQPILALVIFLIISAYHFGQSNWSHISFQRNVPAYFTAMLWGSAVIGIPVLVYFDQSALIIFEATGFQPVLSDAYRWGIVFLLFFGNLTNINYLFEQGTITSHDFRKEVFNILVLTALFLTTPLLVGFGVYFVFWHSCTSVWDQFRIIRRQETGFRFKEYLWGILPLSILAFVFLAGSYFFLGDYFNKGMNLGLLFLFISIITVPHALLMDRFYQMGEAVRSQET